MRNKATWFCHASTIFVLFLQHCLLVVSGIILHNNQVLQEPRTQQQSTFSFPGVLGKDIQGNSKSEDTFKTKHNQETPSSHLIFPGGGIFFYWQAGAVSYLREQKYDLSSCTFSGASAGALAATLTATNVDFYEATELALNLAARSKVWDRSSGLQGIWGPMIYEWLDVLLPDSDNSDNEDGVDSLLGNYLEEGRLSLLVTPIPSFGKNSISNFASKEDLIRCNLASVHIVRAYRIDYRNLNYPQLTLFHVAISLVRFLNLQKAVVYGWQTDFFVSRLPTHRREFLVPPKGLHAKRESIQYNCS